MGIPAFIDSRNPAGLKACVGFRPADRADFSVPESPAERRYALHEVQQRLHEAMFRGPVLRPPAKAAAPCPGCPKRSCHS